MSVIGMTPPMGWNTWNTFYDHIDEGLVLETARAMVETGLRDAGYRYVLIDDCWQQRERDEKGQLVADPEKFPHGMKALSDQIHGMGLKFGMYSCCGTLTCAGYPGSFSHEREDALTFASWGVDYLKYDNCHKPSTVPGELLYRRMGTALRNSGRDIFFAACQWGREGVEGWIHSTGAHSYRSTVDIQDSWASIESIVRQRLEKNAPTIPGCFNDMDMLVAGMYGAGMNPETSATGLTGCTPQEYESHFALWAMLSSPLILGCDIRSLREEARTLLTNRDLIAIDQDPEGRSCYQFSAMENPDAFFLLRPLAGGELALGFFNFSDVPADMTASFWDLGLVPGQEVRVHDCLGREEDKMAKEILRAKVASHGCRVYTLKPLMTGTGGR